MGWRIISVAWHGPIVSLSCSESRCSSRSKARFAASYSAGAAFTSLGLYHRVFGWLFILNSLDNAESPRLDLHVVISVHHPSFYKPMAALQWTHFPFDKSASWNYLRGVIEVTSHLRGPSLYALYRS